MNILIQYGILSWFNQRRLNIHEYKIFFILLRFTNDVKSKANTNFEHLMLVKLTLVLALDGEKKINIY